MESASITSQLGIDWKLLLSQAVNFLLLLIILRIFVYKPILNILKKRQERIEEGMAKAEEADVRLKEVDEIGKKKLKEAENTAVATIKKSEDKAKEVEKDLLEKAKAKETAEMEKLALNIEREKEQAKKEMEKEAAIFVKKALVKTVELHPDEIDEKLIRKAVEQIS